MHIKKTILILLLALTILGCNKSEPDGYLSDGSAVHLSDYQGKWVVVNYWATWCTPCLKELPELNNLYKNHQNQLIVLGVSFDELSHEEISVFAKSLHLTFPMLNTFKLEKFGVNQIPSIPATFLISPEGKLVKTLYGPQTEESLMEEIPPHPAG